MSGIVTIQGRRIAYLHIRPCDPRTQALSVASLDSLAIDEADLILSYGHDEDIRQIFHGGFLPQVFQSFLMSATMTEDVELLKGLTLRNAVRAVPTHVDML